MDDSTDIAATMWLRCGRITRRPKVARMR
ncbi:hypothetical protein CSOJ01_15916 [Colletotrichum sojae]|uniref:Uncharacterized protein n=1 Tax=Colletotrichum sojae TaxID=2175907 RepID=A0A8H6ILN0_9PEZI|nr:hypothetical protein CSOJ01_15916 [Colletotrichum sojae]